MCMLHSLPSNVAVCILKIYYKGGSDDFKCNFFRWRNHAVSISERLILSVLSLNIITRNKGRCIKHFNYTHLVMGLFKQVWPPKPDGEVRRSKWYKLGLTKILCMDIQWCELMIWSYTYSKRAFVLPIAYLFCSYIASRTSLQKTSFQGPQTHSMMVVYLPPPPFLQQNQ